MHSRNMFFKGFSILVLALVVWGCSKSNDNTPTVDSSGRHPTGWVVAGTGGTHPNAYLNSPVQCFECHGKDLMGGISNVSCFSTTFKVNGIDVGCHPKGPSGHPGGFADPSLHGPQAKAAVGGINGFSFCQKCHGADFKGGIAKVSCIACHGVNAPHSPKPWRGNPRTHANTDFTNAPVCAQCHTAGANLSPVFQQSSYATGTPGCFNNTLCHGQVGHVSGFANPDLHGAAAKGAPGGNTGLAYCQLCHGYNLKGGGGTAVSCFTQNGCHSTAPHSPAPWRIASGSPSTRTHRSTDTGNAIVCALCHLNNQRLTTPLASLPSGTSPDCFNNTLCHGVTGHQNDPQPWKDPSNHGARAKQAPVPGSGFSNCQVCHGPTFTGGRALTTCINNPIGSCHSTTAVVAAPHSPKPWLGGARTHITTDQGNAVTCAACHTAGANLTQAFVDKYAPYATGTPSCFNNTLCHSNLNTCTGCHSKQQGSVRRAIVGPTGDFVMVSHHVTNGTSTEIVTDAACIVCHGDLQTARSHPNGQPADPSVDLKDPDTGVITTYNLSGSLLALEGFCVKCHDANGSVINGAQPFSAATGGIDNSTPKDIGWTTGAMVHSVNMACFNCHGNSAGVTGNTLNPKLNGHGSATAKLLQNPAGPSPVSTNICYNCHGTATFTANGTTDIQSQFAKTYRHATPYCTDCHNPHTAASATHVTGTNTASGAITGASGVAPTYGGIGWTAPTAYPTRSPQAATQFEYEICMKCHNGNTIGNGGTGAQAWTDIGLEFNPNNASGHPVVAANTGAKALTAGAMGNDWTFGVGKTMYCSDCHASDTAASKGPHGSAIKWMLKGNRKAWPYTLAANNGTSGPAVFWAIGTAATGTGDDRLFCLNCHIILDNPHKAAGGHIDAINCVNCHLRVPHGGKISRLISTTTMSNITYKRYYPDGNGGGGLNLTSFTPTTGTYIEDNCDTNCGGHGNPATQSW